MQRSERALPAPPRRNRIVRSAMVGVTAALALTACKHLDEGGGHVAGWSIIDSNQRHPIVVSSEPARMSVRVSRESHGLAPQQRARVVEFLESYKRRGGGSARLLVGVPSGAPNEVAAMHGLADIRHLVADAGLSESSVVVQAYHDEADPNPPIRISFDRHVAEGPQCGHWATNLSRSSDNLPYPNFGCAQQRNLAAMIANPADLLHPRTMDPRPSERRDVTWEKFQKGESTGAQKSEEEKVKVKGVQ
jgi:pilus assembly protein CpaD